MPNRPKKIFFGCYTYLNSLDLKTNFYPILPKAAEATAEWSIFGVIDEYFTDLIKSGVILKLIVLQNTNKLPPQVIIP